MKKVIALMLAFIVCVCLFGCPDNNDQYDNASDSSQNTSETGDRQETGNNQSDDISEIPESTLALEDWQLDSLEYLSYEAYFGVQREFTTDAWPPSDGPAWIKDGRIFTLKADAEACQVYVLCEKTGEKFFVPNGRSYSDYTILGADGRYGYMHFEGCMIRMNLANGEVDVIRKHHIPGITSFCVRDNLVLYYGYYLNESLEIGRVYLPELRHEILYSTHGEFHRLAFQWPKTNTGPVTWRLMNPEFINYLEKELANPDSKHKNDGQYDFSEICESDDSLNRLLDIPMLVHDIQKACGIRALLKCTYDATDGKYTETTGVIDTCSYGSGYPHDHYNPEVTTAEPVEVIMSQWTNFKNPLPDIFATKNTNTHILVLSGVDSGRYLYVDTDGSHKMLVNTPVNKAINTGNGAIYISADKRSVFAVNYQDAQPVEIYRSTEGDITSPVITYYLDTDRQWLVLRDGDTMVQIDLAANRARQLVHHPHIESYYYIDSAPATTLYFNVAVGLYVEGYTLDLVTGELKAGYRL